MANKGAGLLLDNLVSHTVCVQFSFTSELLFFLHLHLLSKLMFLIYLIRACILWSGQILPPEVEISWNLWHRWTDSRLRHLTIEGCTCSHKLNTVAQMLHVYLLYSPFRCVAWGRSKTSISYEGCFFNEPSQFSVPKRRKSCQAKLAVLWNLYHCHILRFWRSWEASFKHPALYVILARQGQQDHN